jgi:hypothetical protein
VDDVKSFTVVKELEWMVLMLITQHRLGDAHVPLGRNACIPLPSNGDN